MTPLEVFATACFFWAIYQFARVCAITKRESR
jgi:hypothetical protein